MESGNGADTPGVKGDEVEGELMSKSEASRFRRAAAKINYLSQDRLDLAFASKELSRHMATPRVGDEALAKRVVRYLKMYPRLVVEYNWQEDANEISVFTDSDWGGCVKTRRSRVAELCLEDLMSFAIGHVHNN